MFSFLKLSLVILLIFCTVQTNAQPQEEEVFNRFGFQAGANFSNMDFNKGYPAPAVPVASSWKAGLSIGFLMRVPLDKDRHWLLQPEYSYTQRNGSDKSIGTSYQLDYFTLPVLVHYQINSLLSLYAGPQAELLIHATGSTNGVKTNITHDTEERSIAGIGGVECRFAKSFFVSARYMYGFNHIGIAQRSANTKEFKYSSVNLTAGVSF